MNHNNVKFAHFPEDGLCIAYTPDSDSIPAGKCDIFKITTVLCHKMDTYQKKVARNISKNTAIIIDEHFIPSFKPAKVFVEQIKSSEKVKVANLNYKGEEEEVD
jgi:hypothetical protein